MLLKLLPIITEGEVNDSLLIGLVNRRVSIILYDNSPSHVVSMAVYNLTNLRQRDLGTPTIFP